MKAVLTDEKGIICRVRNIRHPSELEDGEVLINESELHDADFDECIVRLLPDGTIQRSKDLQKALWKVDQETESRINRAMHPMAPLGEQIGILRDQLVHVLNALGIKPTPEFARLNEIAIKEIEAAREKKEEISAQDNSS